METVLIRRRRRRRSGARALGRREPVDTIRSGVCAARPPLPYTPGNDGAGEVLAVGAEVSGFKPGDRVAPATTWARRAPVCARNRRSARRRNSTGCPARQLRAGRSVGVHARRPTRCSGARTRGQTILVHGASSGVGIAAVERRARTGCSSSHGKHGPRPRRCSHTVRTSSSTTGSGYLDAITKATGEGRRRHH